MRTIMGRGVDGGGRIDGEKLMRKKERGGGKQERDLITVGSEGIKTEMRETCVIAPLSWINTNPERRSVCHVLELRCGPRFVRGSLYCDLLCSVRHTSGQNNFFFLITSVCTQMGLCLSIVLLQFK